MSLLTYVCSCMLESEMLGNFNFLFLYCIFCHVVNSLLSRGTSWDLSVSLTLNSVSFFMPISGIRGINKQICNLLLCGAQKIERSVLLWAWEMGWPVSEEAELLGGSYHVMGLTIFLPTQRSWLGKVIWEREFLRAGWFCLIRRDL